WPGNPLASEFAVVARRGEVQTGLQSVLTLLQEPYLVEQKDPQRQENHEESRSHPTPCRSRPQETPDSTRHERKQDHDHRRHRQMRWSKEDQLIDLIAYSLPQPTVVPPSPLHRFVELRGHGLHRSTIE